MSRRSLYDAIAAGTDRRGAPAMRTEGRTWTYGDLLDAADELAVQLGRRPDPGAPVIVQASDPVCTAVATLAGESAGIAVVHRDPAAVGGMPGWTVHEGDAATPGAEEIAIADRRIRLRPGERCELSDALPAGAQIFLTSGSTGTPTAVVRTAEAVLADARRIANFLGYTPDVPVVVAAPLFHAYGFNYGLLGPLLAGCMMRWCAPRSVPSQLARAVQETGAGTLIALPVHYGLLAAQPNLAEPVWDTMLASLRSAVSAGAPLAPGVAAAIAPRFSFRFYNCYGSSEAGAVTLTRLTGGETEDWIGDPLPGIRARIEALEPSSEVGELLLSTTSLAAERLGPTGRRPLARADGWYATGDLAVAEPSGDGLRLVGRVSSVINVAGEKVSPGEVERVLRTHDYIADVQVIGVPDPARGQVLVARVVAGTATAVPDLVAWCRERLAPHQMPRRFEFVEAIARSATGKPLAESASVSREGA